MMGEWCLCNNVQSDTWYSSNRSCNCPVPQLLVMSSCSVALSSLLRLSLYFFHSLTIFPAFLSILSPGTSPSTLFYLTHPKSLCFLYFSCMVPCLFIHLLPTPLQSLNLHLPPHHPYVSKPTDQTKPLYRFQPSSSNQPNCCRTSCLRERGFLCWETLLNGIKSAIESMPLSHC